jgi:hypothetical protein
MRITVFQLTPSEDYLAAARGGRMLQHGEAGAAKYRGDVASRDGQPDKIIAVGAAVAAKALYFRGSHPFKLVSGLPAVVAASATEASGGVQSADLSDFPGPQCAERGEPGPNRSARVTWLRNKAGSYCT